MKQTNCEYFQTCQVGQQDLCPSSQYSCDVRTELYEKLSQLEAEANEFYNQEQERIEVLKQRHRSLMKQRWEFGER